MSSQSFDYIIVGAGAAGLHLAMQMARDEYFRSKSILILDKEEKDKDDRTWSFWERGASEWDEIAIKSWKKAVFQSSVAAREIGLDDYTYKTIRSSDFYTYAKKIIAGASSIAWKQHGVKDIKDNEVRCESQVFFGKHIFDSRIPADFYQSSNNSISLTQHFLGWFIKTKDPVFDDDRFTMMDYRLKWKDHTSFTYVLPFAKDYALVEFTLFNQELLTKEQYEEKLTTYIKEYLRIEAYDVVEVESGQIPMTTYDFTQHHSANVSKIGTAGGWVRPSSGYSFKNAGRYAQMIVDNIKRGQQPSSNIAKNRFRFYDSIFLKVLADRNELGERVFETLYTQCTTSSLLRFLDEQSSLMEDIKIMNSVNDRHFRRALWHILTDM